MKKHLLTVLISMSVSFASAQVSVPEPEFVNSYCILTSDSTYDVLPKENGMVSEHKSKGSVWKKIARTASQAGQVAGHLGIATAGSVSGVVTGMRVANAAAGVEGAVSVVSALSGSAGMDIVFSGGSSPYTAGEVSDGVRILVRCGDNSTDPVDLYRIVRFAGGKKDRRVQWMEFSSSLLGSSEAEKGGYVTFSGHRYGEESYLLEVPASEIRKGEYGVFYLGIETAAAVPVATFSVK